MAGLATHLHYHEPANFVFVSFLQQGLFHKLCKRQKKSEFQFIHSLLFIVEEVDGLIYV